LRASGSNSANVSMQMDSIDRGSQTAQFGAVGANQSSFFNQSGSSDFDSQSALVEEISQTFTTLRDCKRKEAL